MVLKMFRRWLKTLPQRRQFAADYRRFRSLMAQTEQRFPLSWKNRKPMLDERTALTSFDRHYVYHTAWAARILAQTRPSEHVDISSMLYFNAILSAFIPVRFYDYRPPDLTLSELAVSRADVTSLPFADRSVKSLSCMHVVEHIGLGRYGDPLDPDGDLTAMNELKRVLAPGGSLLFVVPVGTPKIVFNAHRIYAYRQVVQAFRGLTLRQFALIAAKAKDGGLILDADEAAADRESYGCGCFWFTRH